MFLFSSAAAAACLKEIKPEEAKKTFERLEASSSTPGIVHLGEEQKEKKVFHQQRLRPETVQNQKEQTPQYTQPLPAYHHYQKRHQRRNQGIYVPQQQQQAPLIIVHPTVLLTERHYSRQKTNVLEHVRGIKPELDKLLKRLEETKQTVLSAGMAPRNALLPTPTAVPTLPLVEHPHAREQHFLNCVLNLCLDLHVFSRMAAFLLPSEVLASCDEKDWKEFKRECLGHFQITKRLGTLTIEENRELFQILSGSMQQAIDKYATHPGHVTSLQHAATLVLHGWMEFFKLHCSSTLLLACLLEIDSAVISGLHHTLYGDMDALLMHFNV